MIAYLSPNGNAARQHVSGARAFEPGELDPVLPHRQAARWRTDHGLRALREDATWLLATSEADQDDTGRQLATWELRAIDDEIAYRARRGLSLARPPRTYGLSPDFIAEVKRRVDIADAFRDAGLQLFGRGPRYRTNCPFHEGNRTPSLVVYAAPDDQRWNCFACGRSGDVIEFECLRWGFSFPEMVRFLAGRAGLPWPATPTRQTPRSSRTITLRNLPRRLGETHDR